MVEKEAILGSIAAVGLGLVLGITTYKDLKIEAERLREEDIHKITKSAQIDITCRYDPFNLVGRAEVDVSTFRTEAIRFGRPGRIITTPTQGNYFASSSQLSLLTRNYCEGCFDPYKLNDGFTTYVKSTPELVFGLPPDLAGKEVTIMTYIPTTEYPHSVHLGSEGFIEDEDYYKISEKRVTLSNGTEARRIRFVGPLDYCVTNKSDHFSCSEKMGQLVVTVKPDNFDQTCHELIHNMESEIQNLPPVRSYMREAFF